MTTKQIVGVIDPKREVGHIRADHFRTECGLDYSDWDALIVSVSLLAAYGVCQACAERAYKRESTGLDPGPLLA